MLPPTRIRHRPVPAVESRRRSGTGCRGGGREAGGMSRDRAQADEGGSTAAWTTTLGEAGCQAIAGIVLNLAHNRNEFGVLTYRFTPHHVHINSKTFRSGQLEGGYDVEIARNDNDVTDQPFQG